MPADEVWPGLSNRILQRTGNGKGSTDTQAQAKYAAVQLPQPVLEPVPPREALEAGSVGGGGGLVREEAIDDHGVEGDDDGGREDDIDAQPGNRDALMFGKGVVESVVVEREGLVEGGDLVDNGKDEHQDAAQQVSRAFAGGHEVV